jgi:hypothetical protein
MDKNHIMEILLAQSGEEYQVPLIRTDIEEVIARNFGLTLNDLSSGSRMIDWVLARYILIYFRLKATPTPTGQDRDDATEGLPIGRCTTYHALNVIQSVLETKTPVLFYEAVKNSVNEINQMSCY